MNQRNNQIHYVALAVSIILIGFGIYQYGPFMYQHGAQTLNISPAASTSTVTVSAEKLAELEQTAADYEALRREVSASSTATNTATAKNASQSAAVIGRPPQSPYDTLVLDIGHADGVELGQAVWWPAGVHLGEIVDVREHSAVVELLSSPNVTHPAVVNNTPITVEGRGGDEMYAEIPQAQSAAVGDVVVSDRYNMPVGTVVATKDITAQNIQALYISRFVSSATIETVYVQTE